MIACEIGDVVAVEFPFSDLQGRKRRPGLILEIDASDALLARITTHPARDARDVTLLRWNLAGLPKPSTVRLTKLATVDRRLPHYRIGRLPAEDATAVARTLESWMASIVSLLQGVT